MVFLTATLAPQDEGAFFRSAEIRRTEAVMVRSRTTRRNIRYRVREVREAGGSEETAVVAEVRRIVSSGTGKVIVYCGRIRQAQDLARRLDCPVFHSKVDSREGKARRLKAWVERGRVMVATNAMGVGIDIPDIRGVVHAGQPRRLRDYAQESGRGGRDGLESEAVIVCRRGGARQTKDDEVEDGGERRGREEMEEFIWGGGCRRVVLDRVMDGRVDRTGCEEGEERCDICEDKEVSARIREGEGSDTGTEKAVVEEQVEGIFTRENVILKRVQARRAEEGQEIYELRRMMEDWAGRCVVCKLRGAESEHGFWECRVGGADWTEVRVEAARLASGLFKGRKLQEFSGCYRWGCGVPQAWCNSWEEAEGDGGSYVRKQGGWQCQFRGVLVEGSMGLLAAGKELGGDEVIEELMSEAGVDSEDLQSRYGWFGKKIRWGGIETNNLCRVFYILNKIVGEVDQGEL